MKKKLDPIERFFYVLACILSGGILWILKIVMEKAIIDLKEDLRNSQIYKV